MFENKNKEDVAIETVIKNYFQGYLNADPETLLKAFHSGARLFCVGENGILETTEMSDWLKNLADRRAKGDIRQADARIDSIEVSDDAAVVKVTLVFNAFQFTDYLSLLRLGSAWKIVNKIYTVKHFEQKET